MNEFLGRPVADCFDHGEFTSVTTIVHRNPRTNNPRRWHFFIVRKSDGVVMQRKLGNKHWQQTRKAESDATGLAMYLMAWKRFVKDNAVLSLDDLVERNQVGKKVVAIRGIA